MHKSKNLYNATLWYYRQALEDHQKAKEEKRDPVTEYPDYYKMERKFRDERQINYFDLPQKVSQWVLKDVQSDWRAFAKLVVKNVGWKQECDMNGVNTQNFVQIPHARLIDMLSYKARQLGIACLTTEESYTSKCSFLDNEEMCHHDRYAGRRTKRGLFVSASGKKINADLNAALNMIRKVIPNAFQAQGIEALVVAPVRLLWRTKLEIGAFH